MNLDWISLGCHNLTAGSSRRRSERLVHAALDLGIRRFDVAPSYGLGTAERMLGDALGSRRNDPGIAITTKFGILPPRHGAAKAWLREPVRAVRSLAGRPVPVPAPASPAGAASPGNDPIAPDQALERSLKALRVERVATLLTHEAVVPDRRDAHYEVLSRLRDQGRIGDFGCSGAIDAILPLLASWNDPACVAQVAVRDWPRLPATASLRGFNVGRLATGISGDAMLRRSLGLALGREDTAGAIAATLAWAHRRQPRAILLVNASTPRRLTAVIELLADAALEPWLDEQEAAITALAWPEAAP